MLPLKLQRDHHKSRIVNKNVDNNSNPAIPKRSEALQLIIQLPGNIDKLSTYPANPPQSKRNNLSPILST
jgi:hypothetical protein